MALFSWFFNSSENKPKSVEQENEKVSQNTMWPTAKVRNNTIVQQQKYLNTAEDKKGLKQRIILQESKNP